MATSGSYNDLSNIPASFTPASHTHGNLTNDGKVGTAANKPLITGTDGVVQAGSFGNAANTFCEGNDSRLSDARTPVAHTHTKSDVTDLFNSANTWSGENSFNHANLNRKYNFTLGDNSYQISRIQYQDKDSARWGVFSFIHNTDNSAFCDIGVNCLKNDGQTVLNKSIRFLIQPDNNSEFKPMNDQAIHLGTSINKWKTLNGINPGALSFPNLNYSDSKKWIDLSGNITQLTGGDNWYYPAVNGWVFVITSNNPVSLNVLVLGADNSGKLIAGASGVLETVSGAMWVSSPAPAGSRVRIRANNGSTGTIETAWFITCQGNV